MTDFFKKCLLASLHLTLNLLDAAGQGKAGNISASYELRNIGQHISNFPIQLTSIYQDSKGFIWLGSAFGVHRFDGAKVENVTDLSETMTEITDFIELDGDTMLIGSMYGLGVYAGGVITKAKLDSVFHVNCFARQGNRVFFGTNNGMYEWTGRTPSLIKQTAGWNITSAVSTGTGSVLVYCDKGIYEYAGGKAQLILTPATPEGELFLLDDRHIYYTDTALHAMPGTEPIADASFEGVTDMFLVDEKLFVVNGGELVYRSGGQKDWSLVKEKSDLAGVYKLYRDNTGVIWVMSHFGLSVLQRKEVNQAQNPAAGQVYYQHLDDSFTRVVSEVEDGHEYQVWEKGKPYFLWKKFVPQDDPNAIPGNVLTGLVFPNANECYLAFMRGEKYYYCSKGKAVPVSLSERLYVSGMVYDTVRKNVWVQTTSGPALANGKMFTLYSRKNGYNMREKTNTSKIVPDPGGKWLWVGGDRNLLGYFDYDLKQYVYLDSAWKIDVNKNGNLWIGDIDIDPLMNIWVYIQFRGLFKITRNGGKPKDYQVELWDPQAPLGKYMFDPAGNLWVITADSKARIYKAGKDKKLEGAAIFREINLNKDLMEGQFLSHGAFRFNYEPSPGVFSVFSLNNTYTFDLTTLFQNFEKLGKPLITAVYINRKALAAGDQRFTYDIAGLPKKLVLSYRENKIGFYFSSLQANMGGVVFYRYRLDGYETEWQPMDKKNFIEYTKLSPGKYDFIIECSSDGKQWGEPVHFAFEIESPWWSALWIRVAGILLITAIVLWMYKIRTRKFRKRALELESLVEQRTGELVETMKDLELRTDQNAMLLKVIAHDIKGPVRFIDEVSGNLSAKWTELQENERRDFGMEIKKSTQTLYAFISDFLVWLNLKPQAKYVQSEVSIRQLFEYVVKFHTESGNKKDNVIQYEPCKDAADIKCYTNRKYLEIIISNLVDNSCKNTSGGTIQLRAAIAGNNVEITCTDSGRGMSEEKIAELETLKINPGGFLASDSGLGYRFIYSLSGVINASVKIKSAPGAGTTVMLIVPQKQELTNNHKRSEIQVAG